MIQKAILFIIILCSISASHAEDLPEGSLTRGMITACAHPDANTPDHEQNADCLSAIARHQAALEVILRARYVEAYANDMRHRSEIWTWHRFSSVAIFILVFFVVVSGVVMSFIQVRHTGETAITLSEKISVTTPVVGVAVLALSIAFFSLYVTVVYPITIVGEGLPKQQQDTEPATDRKSPQVASELADKSP